MPTDEMIAVLQAYKEGKEIECFKGDLLIVTFDNTDHNPGWNFEKFTYRVKMEPHYRPFESAEEVMEAIKEHGDWVKWKIDVSWKLRVVAIHDEHVQFGNNNIIDHNDALGEWLFCDETPFGKLVEE